MHRVRAFHHSSGASRALRAVIAIMTVWNLGCAGFQPLLAQLAGSGASMGMVCDSDGLIVAPTTRPAADEARVTSVAEQDPAGNAAPSDVVISLASTDDGAPGHAAICGCESCYAPPAPAGAVSVAAIPAPAVPAADPVAPPSIARAPLVPPPQVAL